MTTPTPQSLRHAFSAFTADSILLRSALAAPVDSLWGKPMRVLSCDVAHAWQKTYIKPASFHKSFLNVCYRLQVQPLSGGPEQVSWIHGTVRPAHAIEPGKGFTENFAYVEYAGTHATLQRFPDDTALPQLKALLDPRYASESLARATGSARATDRVTECQVMQYRPGTRCALRYTLTSNSRDTPHQLFAKTYCDDLGERVHARMQALWNAAHRNGHTCHVAQPLGYDPATRTVWQHYIAGISAARAVAVGRAAPRVATLVAHALAALHRSEILADHIHDDGALLRDTFKRVAKLSVALPSLAHPLQDAFDTCSDVQPARAASTQVVTHGDVHLDQFLIHEGRAITVDWDELALGDREQDLAGLIVDMRLRCHTLGVAPPHCAHLIEGYETISGITICRQRLAWHLCLQCLNKCYRLYWRASPTLDETISSIARWARAYADALTSDQVTPS